MKVFITGGAGFLGINLIRALKARGVDEIVSYDIADFDYPEKDWVQVVKEDIRHVEPLREAMKGCDRVVHCAAALPLYPPEDIRTTDLDGTRNVMQAALDLGVERAVQISSTAVYGIPGHHPLFETDKLVGVGRYGEAKVQAESVCVSFREKGLCVPILRPKSFVGPERLGVFALFYDWARTGHNFPMIGRGDNRYQLLDVDDLCDAIWACLTLDKAVVDDVFNIGAREFSTMKDDYQAVLDEAGFGKRIIGFPAAPAIWTLRALEWMKLSPLAKHGYRGARLHEAPLHYRVHGGSITAATKVFDRKQRLMRRIVEKHADFFSEEEARRAIARFAPEAVMRHHLCELWWAGRRAAALRFALHLLAAHPRAFFAKAVFARLFGSHASPR